jgi:hypothetical protein
LFSALNTAAWSAWLPSPLFCVLQDNLGRWRQRMMNADGAELMKNGRQRQTESLVGLDER